MLAYPQRRYITKEFIFFIEFMSSKIKPFASMILVRYIPAQDKRKYIRLGDFFNQSSIQFMSCENKKIFFSGWGSKKFLKETIVFQFESVYATYTQPSSSNGSSKNCEMSRNLECVLCCKVWEVKTFNLIDKVRLFWDTAALDVFAKHVGNNCKGIHLLVASNIYKDDSFTDILQTFCFKWNQIVSRCILEYIWGFQCSFFLLRTRPHGRLSVNLNLSKFSQNQRLLHLNNT